MHQLAEVKRLLPAFKRLSCSVSSLLCQDLASGDGSRSFSKLDELAASKAMHVYDHVPARKAEAELQEDLTL